MIVDMSLDLSAVKQARLNYLFFNQEIKFVCSGNFKVLFLLSVSPHAFLHPQSNVIKAASNQKNFGLMFLLSLTP